ncbi:MAG: hypothetical protein JRH14_22735, partial [Deltaproteobacteria bacterium]|nr:hypothetical protein [Deltaproteobacteria bacterium]
RIVLKALERDPEDRWQTAREMGKALRQFLGTQNEIMGPAELSEWMGEVFPQGEARKSQLMEIARMASTSLPTMPQVNDVEESLTATDVRLVGTTEIPEPRSGPRKFLAVAVLAAVAIIGAIALGIGAPSETEPVAVEGSASPDETLAEAAETAPEEQRVEAKPQVQERNRSKSRAKAQPGTINLVTRGGWAQIYEGKKLLGSTPLRLTLTSGRHKLVLKPFGTEKPKTVYVVVEATKTKKVSIALD